MAVGLKIALSSSLLEIGSAEGAAATGETDPFEQMLAGLGQALTAAGGGEGPSQTPDAIGPDENLTIKTFQQPLAAKSGEAEPQKASGEGELLEGETGMTVDEEVAAMLALQIAIPVVVAPQPQGAAVTPAAPLVGASPLEPSAQPLPQAPQPVLHALQPSPQLVPNPLAASGAQADFEPTVPDGGGKRAPAAKPLLQAELTAPVVSVLASPMAETFAIVGPNRDHGDAPRKADAPVPADAPPLPVRVAQLAPGLSAIFDIPQTAAPSPVAGQPVAIDTAFAPAAGGRTFDPVVEQQLDLAHEGEWLDRLARDIARSSGAEGGLRFRLNPEHLGSLHVELRHGDAGTSLRLTADTEAARAIIADAQPRLVAEARAQGVRIAETHVDLGGNGQSASGDPRRHGEERPQAFVRTSGAAAGEAGEPARTAAGASERYA